MKCTHENHHLEVKDNKTILVCDDCGSIFGESDDYPERGVACNVKNAKNKPMTKLSVKVCPICHESDCTIHRDSPKLLVQAEKAINELTFEFCERYELQFNDWVASDIGGIFEASDYWFHFTDVLDAMKLNPTREQLVEWYDQWVYPPKDAVRLNMRTFLALNK